MASYSFKTSTFIMLLTVCYISFLWVLLAMLHLEHRKAFAPVEVPDRSADSFPFAPSLPLPPSRDYFVVIGIAAVVEERRQRRRLQQRLTCWSYASVATRANGFVGKALVLFVFARPATPPQRAALDAEAQQWRDAVIVDMEEDALPYVRNQKTMGTQIKMSQKTFLWFDMALRLFPQAEYIAKGDEDMFLRVPQYLADLNTLPRRGLYWGKWWKATLRLEPKTRFAFMVGSLFTVSRDVAQCVVSYESLRKLAFEPYTEKHMKDYMLHFMDHEDGMFGQVVSVEKHPVVFVNDERFHNFFPSPVPNTSVLIHYLKLEDYNAFKLLFSEDNISKVRFAEIPRADYFYGKTMLVPVI